MTTADVVVHDHLVDRRLLQLIRSDAETIEVGPARPHSFEQDAICLLIAEKAREGKTVARLKWGDPFVFDSGGKEALFLQEQGLPFEVVPGIPSGIGGPTYAGIPVTYPEAGDALTLVRGDERETGEPAQVDWKHLAKVKGTIVTYGAGPQLAATVKALRRHGRPMSEPAALIYHATLPNQHTIQETLAEIEELVCRSGHRGTAVLVVGQVAALRQRLRWYDSRPLFGLRIVVTRARDQAEELVTHLKELGADPIEAPTIEIVPADDPAPLDDACARIGSFDWIVFSSTNAASYFMSHLLASSRDVRDLKEVQLCAVGPSTADSLSRYGLKVDLVPEEYRGEGVVRALEANQDLTGARILLPRANLASDELPDRLRHAGADVTTVTAYQTADVDFDTIGGPDIYRLLLEGKIDIVTFTSGSSVRNFSKVIGVDQMVDLLNQVDVACIGPITARAASRLGITTAIMPSDYTVPAMVQAIVRYVNERRQRTAPPTGR